MPHPSQDATNLAKERLVEAGLATAPRNAWGSDPAPYPYRTAHRNQAVAMPDPGQDATNMPKVRVVVAALATSPRNAWGKRPCPRPLSYCA
jgi:hypothetical protein